MNIGIIGAGQVAQAFAHKAIGAGHTVILSSRRGPDNLAALVEGLGPSATAATPAKVAENPVVLLAVPWPEVDAALRSLPTWHGQILIDATNGFGENGLVDFDDGSSSETVAALAPGAHVVKAMNSLFMANFALEPISDGFRRVVFVAGDDSAAKTEVADLFESFGFASIDLGTLRKGGRMQAVGSTLAGHDFFLPWPAPRSFPAFNGER
ncbi:NAD(P)-binding domain-containing protein [Halomonas sp. SpR8]|uniref:NADPH-dependent F420 reductase n=1 Tax=Halomonas sp. SpR8 TaxID=3050463 RepID=UPI0027E4D6BE|nr:NAD(P)-binding domain-containing protein [Halomonas sp. SpR8]MDQ7727867.1 NAD(P)-binding domain-containing protein [Halomonas sp. SpR8]